MNPILKHSFPGSIPNVEWSSQRHPGIFSSQTAAIRSIPLDDFHFLSHCLDYAKTNMYLAEVRTDELRGAIHFVEGLDVNT